MSSPYAKSCYNTLMPIPAQPLDTSVCFRCGECCKRYQVLLDAAEANRLSEHLGISLADFRTRYADPRWPGSDKLLLRQSSGACPFLHNSNKEFLCTVHKLKPGPCREWAADLSKPECKRGLKSQWELTVDNTGCLQGASGDIRAFLEYHARLSGEGD